MGARLLRRWIGQPLLDLDEIRGRQDAVAALRRRCRSPRAAMRQALAQGRRHRAAGQPRRDRHGRRPRDLGVLRAFAGSRRRSLPPTAAQLPGCPALDAGARLPADAVAICSAAAMATNRRPSSATAASSGPGSPPSWTTTTAAREAREWIAGLERAERERTGIRSLKVGYNRVFGYYIEISTAALAAQRRSARRRRCATSCRPTTSRGRRSPTPRATSPPSSRSRDARPDRPGDPRGARGRPLPRASWPRSPRSRRPPLRRPRPRSPTSMSSRHWPRSPRTRNYVRPSSTTATHRDQRRPAPGPGDAAAARRVRPQRRRLSTPTSHRSSSSPARTWPARAPGCVRSR